MKEINTYEGLLRKEEQLGTRAVARALFTSDIGHWQAFHFLWLVRRNYSSDLIELINQSGWRCLDCLPDERISEFFNHFPNIFASRLANDMFWYANFNRRVFLRPYVNNKIAIKVFLQQYSKVSQDSFESEMLTDVVTYLRKKGLIEDISQAIKVEDARSLEINLTDDYKIMVPLEDQSHYANNHNYGLKLTLEANIRTIVYQSLFLKKQAYCISDKSDSHFHSTQQKLLICGNLGVVIFYYFPDIKKIVAVRGWIAWPILIYDLLDGSINNINHKKNEAVEDYRPYIESIKWDESDQRNGDVALLIGFNSNIGHFYHNELSGLHNLIVSGDIKYINKIICYKYMPIQLSEFIKSIGQDITVINYVNDKQLIEDVKNCRFAIRVTDSVPSQRLATDLINYSYKYIKRIPPQHSEGVVSILFTVRTGRRRLVNQSEVFVEAIKLLIATYGKVLIIFDGVTAVNWQDISTLVAEEEGLVGKVIDAFVSSTDVFFESIIGHSLEQKISVISQCDFAITVKGNGLLPTVQWIANIPAFVHGNSTDLGIFWETSLGEDLLRPFVVSPSVVRDASLNQIITAGTWSERQLDSYHISPTDFVSQLSMFLQLQH